MTRAIAHRYLLSCEIETTSPLHVGGHARDRLIDMVLATDGQGRHYIPGTSLAGALRSWLTASAAIAPEKIEQIWGFQSGPSGHASFIIVEDAPVHLPKNGRTEIRDGVGIDRKLGTSAPQIKFDRELIPRGSWFTLKLTLDVPETGPPTEEDITRTIRALKTGLEKEKIYLGAAKSRGCGGLKLKTKEVKISPKGGKKKKQKGSNKPGPKIEIQPCLEVRKYDLKSPEGILAFLQDRKKNQGELYQPQNLTVAEISQGQPQITIKIDWRPSTPVMVKGEAEGIAVNILPLTSQVGEKISLVMPGSSLKGALRFAAERIIRTLMQQDILTQSSTEAPSAKSVKQKFGDRLELPLIATLFGAGKSAMKKQGSKGTGRQSVLWVKDCYQKHQMGVAAWQEIATAKDAQALKTQLKNAGLKETQQAYHVAIDRWTGGAANKMLYSKIEPFGVEWEKLEMTLHLSGLEAREKLPAIALILLLLKDLKAGRIPLGYGVNRGMGSIEVKEFAIKGSGITTDILPLESKAIEKMNRSGIICSKGDITQIDRNLLETIDRSWQEWRTNLLAL